MNSIVKIQERRSSASVPVVNSDTGFLSELNLCVFFNQVHPGGRWEPENDITSPPPPTHPPNAAGWVHSLVYLDHRVGFAWWEMRLGRWISALGNGASKKHRCPFHPFPHTKYQIQLKMEMHLPFRKTNAFLWICVLRLMPKTFPCPGF